MSQKTEKQEFKIRGRRPNANLAPDAPVKFPVPMENQFRQRVREMAIRKGVDPGKLAAEILSRAVEASERSLAQAAQRRAAKAEASDD